MLYATWIYLQNIIMIINIIIIIKWLYSDISHKYTIISLIIWSATAFPIKVHSGAYMLG